MSAKEKLSDRMKAISSLLIGWVGSATIGFFVFLFLYQLIFANTGIQPLAIIGGLSGGILPVILLGWAGTQQLGFLEKAVGIILGQRVRYELPPGRSWWVPSWLSGDMVKVNVAEQVLERSNQEGNPIPPTYSADNIQVEMCLQVMYAIDSPLKYSELDDPMTSLNGVIESHLRWLITMLGHEEIPKMKGELSSLLLGEIAYIVSNKDNLSDGNERIIHINEESLELLDDKEKGEKREQIEEAKREYRDRRSEEPLLTPITTIRVIADRWGINIKRMFITDVNWPEEITREREKQQMEQIQKTYEATNMGTVLQLMDTIKEKYPNLSDQEVVNIVQTERGKAQRYLVEGSAGDFTKGAGLQTGGQSQKGVNK